MRGCVLLPGHVVYILCALVAQMCDAGWLAMLACAPLTCLHCFLSPNPTHASGSLPFLQQVSDRLAARHVVLVVCPRCTDVCFCRPCGVYYVPLLPRCVMLVGYGGMCPSDSPALCCFVLPHMHLDPPFLQLVSDRLVARHVVLVVCPRCADVCCCPAMWCIYYVPLLPRCVMLAGYAGMLCLHVPL